MAGELHNDYDAWEYVLRGYYKCDEILGYIKHGVSTDDFLRPFLGHFKESHTNQIYPQENSSRIANLVTVLRTLVQARS